MKAREGRRRWGHYLGLLWLPAIMAAGSLALSSALAPEEQGLLWRQLSWYGVGLLAAWAVSRFDYRWIVSQAAVWYGVMVLALLGVLILGQIGGGSRRWLGVGALRLQPSEFANLVVILWAAWWASIRPRVGGARAVNLLFPGTMIGIMAGLVLVQPDLGTAIAIFLGGLAVLYVAGIAPRVQAAIVAAGGLVAGFGWFFLRPYQKKRIIGFLDPESDPLGIGYHTIQSKIAVGAGQVWGQGFGEGTQAALRFLPEQHTDFIFSVWAEEWGFIGGIVLFLMYAGFLYWVGRTAVDARDNAGRLLAAGILAHFVLHIGINLAMALGLAPVVGIPLPWMTYGGSAVLVNCLAVGLLLSIRLRRHLFQ